MRGPTVANESSSRVQPAARVALFPAASMGPQSLCCARAHTAWLTYALICVGMAWASDTRGQAALTLQVMIMSLWAASYRLQVQVAGLLSFGHAAGFGLGAYAVAWGLRSIPDVEHPLWLVLSPVLGVLAGAWIGLVAGALLSRWAGAAFAMMTLALGELLHAAAQMLPGVSGGQGGMSFDRVLAPGSAWSFASLQQLQWLVLLWCIVGFAAVLWTEQSRYGLMARAARDQAGRFAALGYSPQVARWRMLLVSHAAAGLAGGLWALQFEVVSPDVFGAVRSSAVLLAAFIGGVVHPLGPLVGAALYTVFVVELSALTRAWSFYLGLWFMASVLLLPGGLSAVFFARSGQRMPGLLGLARMAVIVPGLVWLVELTYRAALPSSAPLHSVWTAGLFEISNPGNWAWAMILLGLGVWFAMRIEPSHA